VVRGALVGEHQPAVPAAQRALRDAQHVEDREPDPLEPGVVQQPIDLRVPEHMHHPEVVHGGVGTVSAPSQCVVVRLHVVGGDEQSIGHDGLRR
jgi:hypothetical protein